jgi:predicted transcriptional regulator
MKRPDSIIAKATTDAARSDAIVVSFDIKWYKRLRERTFSAVIRKRIPKTVSPRSMYFHINAPKSAVCGKASVTSVRIVGRSEVLSLTRELDMTEDMILAYLGPAQTVGCYSLGTIALPPRDLTVNEIRQQMIYHPPQSFFVLSNPAKLLLDELCGFTAGPDRG